MEQMEQAPRKKHHRPLLLLVVLVALVAIWTFWPKPLGHLLPTVSDKAVADCYVLITSRDPREGDMQMMDLPVHSQGYAQLVALLDSTTYVKNPMDLLRFGRAADTQTITLDPHYATIYFHQGAHSVSLELFGPKVVVSDAGGDPGRSYFPLGGQAFQQEVIDLLLKEHSSFGGLISIQFVIF